jgi:hypothetical protein
MPSSYDRRVRRHQVESRAIRSIGYDADGHTLELEFTAGAIYRYFDVPEFIFRALMHAKSKGQFFQTSINNRYRFEEITQS